MGEEKLVVLVRGVVMGTCKCVIVAIVLVLVLCIILRVTIYLSITRVCD